MSDFPECDKLSRGFRRICRGEAGYPLNGPNSTNAYRVSWGLPPLDDQGRPTAFVPWCAAGPGTHLHRLFARFGVTPTPEVEVPEESLAEAAECAVALRGCSCRQMVSQMDAMGPDGCEEHFDEILDGIRENAALMSHKYYVSLDKIPFFMKIVGVFVRTAIKLARRDLEKAAATGG